MAGTPPNLTSGDAIASLRHQLSAGMTDAPDGGGHRDFPLHARCQDLPGRASTDELAARGLPVPEHELMGHPSLPGLVFDGRE